MELCKLNFIRMHPEYEIAGVTIADWINLDSELSVDAYAQKMAKKCSWGGGEVVTIDSLTVTF